MAKKHIPSTHLCALLAGLLARAKAHPGALQTARLTNNLKVDVTVKDDKDRGAALVHLQISRSSRYPTASDWAMILRHWPYPVWVSPTSEQRYGRRYLTASWPSQVRFSIIR